MPTPVKRDKAKQGLEQVLCEALADFEMESRLACRALRVRAALTVFGVGTLLANDLPEPSRSSSATGNTPPRRTAQ